MSPEVCWLGWSLNPGCWGGFLFGGNIHGCLEVTKAPLLDDGAVLNGALNEFSALTPPHCPQQNQGFLGCLQGARHQWCGRA